MVQAHALLVALALTVTVSPALAADPICDMIREQAKQYTMKQIREMAQRHQLSEEQWAKVKKCLGDKK